MIIDNVMMFPKYVTKPWGYENWITKQPEYAAKLIFVKAGTRLSLQYHKKKKETMYLHEGSCKLTTNYPDGELRTVLFNPGEAFEIPPGTIHRLEAVNDSIIFEVSTPELDDVVRIEDDYGREDVERPNNS
jgi:mannose-6-phosphate isomerase-like protein (cupin superfamily)